MPASSWCDVVRVGELPRVDKRTFNAGREEERKRNSLLEQAQVDAGQNVSGKRSKKADPYYRCKKWLHKG